MITLVTGTPGAGKTLYSLRFMRDLEKDYRYVYAHGITGLTIQHEIVVCESKTCDFCQNLPDYGTYKKAKDWNSYADDGSVFFIDECQHIYRNKGSMSVSEFETHRHKGLDFYLVTQHPMLINTDLRRLVGRHIHLIADFLGRHQYEWVECSQNLAKSGAIKSKYKLDKSLFALYHSASIHTKQQRKFPAVVYVFFASILLLVYMGFKLKARFTPVSSPPVAGSASPVPVAGSVSPAPVVGSVSPAPVVGSALPPPVPPPVVRSGVPAGRVGSNLIVDKVYSVDKCKGQVSKDGKTYRVCFTPDAEIIYLVLS